MVTSLDLKEFIDNKLKNAKAVTFKNDRSRQGFSAYLTRDLMEFLSITLPKEGQEEEQTQEKQDQDTENTRRARSSVIQINNKPGTRGATVLTEGESARGDEFAKS